MHDDDPDGIYLVAFVDQRLEGQKLIADHKDMERQIIEQEAAFDAIVDAYKQMAAIAVSQAEELQRLRAA